MSRVLSILFFFFFISAIAQPADFHVYLIGDGGKLDKVPAPYQSILQQQITNDKTPSAIIFLGDNIYPKGMLDEDSKGRKRTETVLQNHLKLVPGFNGKIIFVPGNHDWKRGS